MKTKSHLVFLLLGLMLCLTAFVTRPIAAEEGIQTEIPTDPDEEGLDYIQDLYYFGNGTEMPDELDADLGWADMNYTIYDIYEENDFLFNHTYVDVMAIANEENTTMMISLWFYFPADYENETSNITVIEHFLGPENDEDPDYGIDNSTLIYFMNYSAYLEMVWMFEHDPVSLMLESSCTIDADTNSIITIVDGEWLDTPAYTYGMTLAMFDDQGEEEEPWEYINTIDFWVEPDEIGDGINPLVDMAMVFENLQPYVNLFWPGTFEEEETTTSTSSTSTTTSGTTHAHGNDNPKTSTTTSTTPSATLDPLGAVSTTLADNWPIVLILGVAIVMFTSFNLMNAANKTPARKRKTPAKRQR